MQDHSYAGYTAAQLRMMAEAVKYIDATTVLALLDRIAELENQQRQMADDATVIQRIHSPQKAVLYGIIAELEQRAAMAQPAE